MELLSNNIEQKFDKQLTVTDVSPSITWNTTLALLPILIINFIDELNNMLLGLYRLMIRKYLNVLNFYDCNLK